MLEKQLKKKPYQSHIRYPMNAEENSETLTVARIKNGLKIYQIRFDFNVMFPAEFFEQ